MDDAIGRRVVLVDRARVEQNELSGRNDPVFTVIDEYGQHYFGTHVTFLGPTELKYSQTKPFGARVWIETFASVIVKNGWNSESVLVPVVEDREWEAGSILGTDYLS
jgi:hypothetical protein